MHILILTLLAAAIAFAGFGPASATVTLRSNVAMTGAEVRVDHIFTGTAKQDVIATTPEPGRRLVLDVYTLQRIARKYDIEWRPRSRFDQTVVTRESRVMEAPEIEETLWRELTARGMSKNHKVELTNRSVSVHVATGLMSPFKVENPVFDEQTGRVSAILAVATDTGKFVRYRLDGGTYTVVDVPVLTRRMRRDETIEKQDVVWKKFRRDVVGRNVLMDPEGLVGQAARRYLPPGRPLMTDDVEPPKIVRKGGIVTMFFETKNLQLTVKARATEDGAMNDTIRVVNVRSNKVVEAVVAGPTKVVIPTPSIATN